MQGLGKSTAGISELRHHHGPRRAYKAGEWALLSELARRDRFQVDTVSYVDERGHPALLEENRMYVGQYRNHLKIGGYKIFLDGSPQGRTAWMSAPYEQAADGYRGYPVCQDGEDGAAGTAGLPRGGTAFGPL